MNFFNLISQIESKMIKIAKSPKRINQIRFTLLFLSLVFTSFAQNVIEMNTAQKADSNSIYEGLKFRSIGPALMSGRISDIVIHPNNVNVWYVTVGSGGVWKTENAGTTWNSLFDKQVSYSIGCITLDPRNPEIVWIGTGENVGGRHIGYGDGIYKSENGGKTWTNMGLKKSEHLSKIIIHPTDSNIIWVASQGPLWSSGGERGVFKSINGGKTWKRTLGDEIWEVFIGRDILSDQMDIFLKNFSFNGTISARVKDDCSFIILASDEFISPSGETISIASGTGNSEGENLLINLNTSFDSNCVLKLVKK